MSENYRAEAELNVSVKGTKDFDTVINLQQKLMDGLELTAKEADQLQRAMVRLRQSFATGFDGAQKGLAGSAKNARALGAALKSVDSQMRSFNSAQGGMKWAIDDSSVFNQVGMSNAVSAAKDLERAQSGIISQRYALYDVASTWSAIAAATLGAAGAAMKVAIDFESSFASVQRTSETTGDAAAHLRKELIDLTTELPSTFADIGEIGTLGGQLGIAADGIENFTRVVAQLTATTNLTAEAAGTALGRFQALLGVDSSQFDNLGSSILKVGVNSVATETEIVNIATQISSMGAFAGLTADQVVGLSGALASVGAQPELSRGTITRTFSLMSNAVADGGEALNEFARVSGVSASEFQAAWGTEQFAGVFQRFLRGLTVEGDEATRTLKDLGITSVRDVPLMLRLAKAGDVVTQAFADSAAGFADTSTLTEQYGIVAETTASRLQVLANSFKAILAEVGAGAPTGLLKSLIDLLQGAADMFLEFARTPIGKSFLALAGAVGVAAGALAAYRAVQALTLASMLAMKVAQDALGSSIVRSNGIIKGVVPLMFQMALGLDRVRDSANGAGTALNGAGRGATFLGTALKGMLVGTGVGLVITGLVAGINALTEAFKSSGEKARDYFGDLSGLTEALKKDSEDVSSAIRTFQVDVETSTTGLSQWATDLQIASGAQVELNSMTAQTTTQIENQTVAIGENAKAWLANAIANDTAFQEFYMNNRTLLEQYGFNLGDYLNSILTGDVSTYLNGITAKIQEAQQAAITAADGTDLYGFALERAESQANNAASAMAELQRLAGLSEGAFTEAANAAEYQAEVNQALGISAEDAAEGLESEQDAAESLLDTFYGVIGGTVDVQNALYGLGSSLAENGTSFDAFSAGGRANLEALQGTLSAMIAAAGDDSSALATMLAGLMSQLAAYGVDTVNQLGFVQNMLASLVGSGARVGLAGVTQAAKDAGGALSQGFSAGAAKAAKSAKKAGKGASNAAKEIRTLTDYVNDLQSVFRSAFEFRFGLDQAVDKSAEAYQKFIQYNEDAAEAVADARQNIQDLRATLATLGADRSILEYQLGVAIEYGDSLRATDITAKLGENAADTAKTQASLSKESKNLSTAQQAMSKALDGSTEGSREQRDMVLSLLQAYQQQVAALADTGMSQAQLTAETQRLRAQFVQQLTQMGYNRAEVERYARSFDDLTYAIQRVPRNFTIQANADPAIRAMDEFSARLRSVRSNVDSIQSGINGVNNSRMAPRVDDSALQRQAARFKLMANIMHAQKQLAQATHPSHSQALSNAIDSWQRQLAAMGSFDGGGYTGRGGKYEPAGIVHRGEYVIPKQYVNQSTGLPYANALNHILPSQNTTNNYYNGGYVTAPSVGGSSPQVQLVEIMPHQVQQIINGVTTQLVVDGRVLASTANGANARQSRRGNG